ncbi:CRISPR-associated endonuclease Cas2 [Vibrio sp. JC009]|uniref:CRISPR-associated endonuclease Cas2 n=1 Tax=Vibrio sp. JC009 TaxID=2912314 RepID=UPI0023B1430E|nr:CRISPR-associated endonuclease Cas2 [Vibrio sp. JC009]WED21079.1 CRISPR-associated endonuclease Cas2 [Vibrio sp. JC009]
MNRELRYEVLVAYDVEDNKQRKKLFEQLKDIGLDPIQKSVFWGFVNRAEERAVYRLFSKLDKESDKAFLVRAKLGDIIARYGFGYKAEEFKRPERFEVL